MSRHCSLRVWLLQVMVEVTWLAELPVTVLAVVVDWVVADGFGALAVSIA